MYDASLVDDIASAQQSADASTPKSTPRWLTYPGTESAADSDAGPSPSGPRCGNARLEPGERCDVAIPAGQPGACPEGCSGRDGCSKHVLRGRDCDARCESVHIQERVPDDSCCPEGATAATDNDCVASCNNGVVERGEACDPIASCPARPACVSTDACISARYTGDAAHCTARCELAPIRACIPGDGCCPPGCDHARDNDCAETACHEHCTADASVPPPDDAPRSCEDRHGGGRCEACDCKACPSELRDCAFIADPMRAAACEAIVACAAQHHCTGLDCYCGSASAARCVQFPLGPCAAQIRKAGGGSNVLGTILAGLAGDNAVSSAAALLECRRNNCELQCDL